MKYFNPLCMLDIPDSNIFTWHNCLLQLKIAISQPRPPERQHSQINSKQNPLQTSVSLFDYLQLAIGVDVNYKHAY